MSDKGERIAVTGNQSVAQAVKMARTQVIAAYPITPQTSIVEELADMISRGEFGAEFIHTESEHSSMAACIGASMTGARAFTATSSQGLALMHEMLHWATGARCPVVMGEVNRSLAAPWTILTDQSDSMAQRDTGWMQFYCSSNQEVFDTVILAYKVAEQVLLPAMTVLDAFVLSHCVEAVDIPSQEIIDEFLPSRETPVKLDPADPHAFGGMMFPDSFMEQRYKIQQAMEIADGIIGTEIDTWTQVTGKSLKPVHSYKADDAEYLVLCLGTAFGSVQQAVDDLRKDGIKAGGLRLWQYRPFPAEQLKKIITGKVRLAVLDRALSFGQGAPVGTEIKATLKDTDAEVFSYVGGLGGRELRPDSIKKIFSELIESKANPASLNWVEIRP